MPFLLLATRNSHKTKEFKALLPTDWQIQDLSSFPDFPETPETGRTFQENAELKVLAAASLAATDQWVLADDSGLEVEVLDGAPGIYSARYAGDGANDAANRSKLLEDLRAVDAWGRDLNLLPIARFRCCIAVARNQKIAGSFLGTVEGHITTQTKGDFGFGYDPVFVPTGYQKTFAELPADTKNKISHRAKALELVLNFLLLQSPSKGEAH